MPLADWTESSRMRPSILVISFVAPSAVCNIEIASFAFLTAIFRPEICAPMRSAIASPAASSLALLMREPVDKRSIAVDMARSFLLIASLAIIDEVLVFITVIMISTFIT